MFARHAKAAGVQGAVDNWGAWTVRADTVEMWTRVFVCLDRLLEFHTDVALDILSSYT